MATIKVIACYKAKPSISIVIEIEDTFDADDDDASRIKAAWEEIRNTQMHIAYNYFIHLFKFAFVY